VGRCTILVSGFTVYGGFQLNPSEEIARMLNGSVIGGCRVESVVLPVSLRKAPRMLAEKLESLKPSLALGLGLSPRARKVTLELAAVSVAHYPDYPDEDGYKAFYEPLPGAHGLEALETRLPLPDVLSECSRRNLPLTASLSAGTYLCNAVAYTIHRYAVENKVPGGFLHLPPTTELQLRHNLPHSIPLNIQAETVKCVIETSLRKAYHNTRPTRKQ
jgi:pyroglutamyl-peptidase